MKFKFFLVCNVPISVTVPYISLLHSINMFQPRAPLGRYSCNCMPHTKYKQLTVQGIHLEICVHALHRKLGCGSQPSTYMLHYHYLLYSTVINAIQINTVCMHMKIPHHSFKYNFHVQFRLC